MGTFLGFFLREYLCFGKSWLAATSAIVTHLHRGVRTYVPFRPLCSLMESYVERSQDASFLHSVFVAVLMDLRRSCLFSHTDQGVTHQNTVPRGGVFSS